MTENPPPYIFHAAVHASWSWQDMEAIWDEARAFVQEHHPHHAHILLEVQDPVIFPSNAQIMLRNTLVQDMPSNLGYIIFLSQSRAIEFMIQFVRRQEAPKLDHVIVMQTKALALRRIEQYPAPSAE